MSRDDELQKLYRRADRLPDRPRTPKSRISFYETQLRIAEIQGDTHWVAHWQQGLAIEQRRLPA